MQIVFPKLGPNDKLDAATIAEFIRNSGLAIAGMVDEIPRGRANVPLESRRGIIKVQAYRVIRFVIKYSVGKPEFPINPKRGLNRRVVCEERYNPFRWGLISLFEESDLITRNERRLFSAEMQYAHAHDVPARFFLGFISQLGTAGSIFKKVSSGQPEDWFVSGIYSEPWYDDDWWSDGNDGDDDDDDDDEAYDRNRSLIAEILSNPPRRHRL